MIIQILDRKQVERIRKMYPEGTQICLDEMEGERNMPSGLKGKVCYVDDAGQIHVNWENGSSLAVLPEVDSFHKIGEPHKRKEHDMQREHLEKQTLLSGGFFFRLSGGWGLPLPVRFNQGKIYLKF